MNHTKRYDLTGNSTVDDRSGCNLTIFQAQIYIALDQGEQIDEPYVAMEFQFTGVNVVALKASCWQFCCSHCVREEA